MILEMDNDIIDVDNYMRKCYPEDDEFKLCEDDENER